MAKSQRSSRKKALRTQRAQRSAAWQAEAEAKRLDALAKCLEAEPIPVVNAQPPADDHDEQQQQRGREQGVAAMAVEEEQQQQQQKPRKKAKKGVKVGAKAGVTKRKGKQALLASQFTKKQKKQKR